MCDGRVAAVRLGARHVTPTVLADGASRSRSSPRDGAARREIAGRWVDEVWDFVRDLARACSRDDIRVLGPTLHVRDAEPRDACSASSPCSSSAGAIVEPHVVLRRDGGPDPRSARRAPCTRSRGSSGRATSARATHPRRPRRRLRRSATRARCAARSATTIVARPLEQGARRLRRPLVPRALGEPRRGHDHEQPQEHVRHRALWTPAGVRDTGMQFLGTLFGDHAKTGIGLRLTTGTRARRRRERLRQRDAAEGRARRSRGARASHSARIASTSSSVAAERMMARRQVDARRARRGVS